MMTGHVECEGDGLLAIMKKWNCKDVEQMGGMRHPRRVQWTIDAVDHRLRELEH